MTQMVITLFLILKTGTQNWTPQSFNYTDTISNLVKFLQRIKFDSRIDLETDDLKENFYRIHGALDSEVIFGIDSECDIPNAFISLRKSNHISINSNFRNTII